MFSTPVAMKHLSLIMLDEDAKVAVNVLADMQVIHLIENQPENNKLLDQFPAVEYQRVFQKLTNRLSKIQHYLRSSSPVTFSSAQTVTLEELQEADKKMKSLWKTISEHEENIRIAKEKMHSARQLSSSLSRFENLNIDLSRLSQTSPFLKIYIGTVQRNETSQLQRALTLANTFIEIFHETLEHDYVTVITETDHQKDILEILKSAGFHELTIPPELRNRPAEIKRNIHLELEQNQSVLDQERAAAKAVVRDHMGEINVVKALITQSMAYASVASSLSGKGQLVFLEGWVPAERSEAVDQQLNARLHYPYKLDLRAPTREEMPQVPSLQKNHRLWQPFQGLVGQFGIPVYGEIDPTKLFALTYILMFGMMFGDIGHGACIILAGILLRKKITGLATFATLTGLSSMSFGYLYGSFFGYEHIIHPVWMSPMEDPGKMLLIALIWGIAFIITANLLSIYNLFSLDHRKDAIFSGKGITGLVFFLGCVFAAFQFMVNQQSSLIELLAVMLPLTVILYHQWRELDGTLAEKILVTFIEGLDSIINNMSNTLSFLRVAAFSLNHVALAAAVFTLAGMMDTFGHMVTVVFGNIFI